MYLLASTLMNGALTRSDRRRAISVLPTPVGPIMTMFLGATSRASSRVELLTPPAVAHRHRDRALGPVLADDVPVELGRRSGGGVRSFTGI